MDPATHLEVLAAEGALFVDAIERGDPDAAVPTCPDWRLRDLVHHTGGIHRWATKIVSERVTEPSAFDLEDIAGGWPADEDLASWFRAGHALLVDALRAAPDDLECWSFLRAPSPLAMWARRQAHETTIHRVDAELASGSVHLPHPAFAADGVDELLQCFLPRRGTKLRSEPARTIGVHATDTNDAWTVTASDEPAKVEIGVGEADVVVRGKAADLYLLVWNRRGLDGVDVTGDASLLDQWRSDVTIRWS